jgi:hypothetical protein
MHGMSNFHFMLGLRTEAHDRIEQIREGVGIAASSVRQSAKYPIIPISSQPREKLPTQSCQRCSEGSLQPAIPFIVST